jgi:hypothetical protein
MCIVFFGQVDKPRAEARPQLHNGVQQLFDRTNTLILIAQQL